MSILNGLTLNGHLDEREIADVWADGTASGATVVHPHLEVCAQCRARLAAFTGWADGLRADAYAEADEIFTRERLAAQQAQILRRLEAGSRAGRVIAFPRFTRPIAASGGSARRWIAGAAAAGLLAGVALGNYLDFRQVDTRRQAAIQPLPTGAQDAGGPGVVPASISDEELLWQLEEISLLRMPETLVAVDSMTPRARDYR